MRHEVDSDLSVDDRTMALARVAALVALGAHAPSYVTACNAALANGATAEEVVGVLLAVGSLVGSVRMVAAAPRIALALGYDVDAALERGDPGALG